MLSNSTIANVYKIMPGITSYFKISCLSFHFNLNMKVSMLLLEGLDKDTYCVKTSGALSPPPLSANWAKG